MIASSLLSVIAFRLINFNTHYDKLCAVVISDTERVANVATGANVRLSAGVPARIPPTMAPIPAPCARSAMHGLTVVPSDSWANRSGYPADIARSAHAYRYECRVTPLTPRIRHRR